MYTPFTRDVADVRKKLMEEVDAFDTCNMVKFLRAAVPFVNEQWGIQKVSATVSPRFCSELSICACHGFAEALW